MTIRAPSAANKRASAAPCPRAPPLMSMTLPLRRSILSSICLKNVGAAYHAMLMAARRAPSSPQAGANRVLGALGLTALRLREIRTRRRRERRFEPSVPSRAGVTSSRGSGGPEVDYDSLLGPVLLGGTE